MKNGIFIDYDAIERVLMDGGFDIDGDGFDYVVDAIAVRIMDNGDMTLEEICEFLAKVHSKPVNVITNKLGRSFLDAQKKLRTQEKFGFLTENALDYLVDIKPFIYTLADVMSEFIKADAPDRKLILAENMVKPIKLPDMEEYDMENEFSDFLD